MLFGRDRDVTAVESLLAEHALVALHGPDGMGKCALASRIAARRVAAGRDRLGPVLVHLRDCRSPAAAAEKLLHALAGCAGGEAAAEQLASHRRGSALEGTGGESQRQAPADWVAGLKAALRIALRTLSSATLLLVLVDADELLGNGANTVSAVRASQAAEAWLDSLTRLGPLGGARVRLLLTSRSEPDFDCCMHPLGGLTKEATEEWLFSRPCNVSAEYDAVAAAGSLRDLCDGAPHVLELTLVQLRRGRRLDELLNRLNVHVNHAAPSSSAERDIVSNMIEKLAAADRAHLEALASLPAAGFDLVLAMHSLGASDEHTAQEVLYRLVNELLVSKWGTQMYELNAQARLQLCESERSADGGRRARTYVLIKAVTEATAGNEAAQTFADGPLATPLVEALSRRTVTLRDAARECPLAFEETAALAAFESCPHAYELLCRLPVMHMPAVAEFYRQEMEDPDDVDALRQARLRLMLGRLARDEGRTAAAMDFFEMAQIKLDAAAGGADRVALELRAGLCASRGALLALRSRHQQAVEQYSHAVTIMEDLLQQEPGLRRRLLSRLAFLRGSFGATLRLAAGCEPEAVVQFHKAYVERSSDPLSGGLGPLHAATRRAGRRLLELLRCLDAVQLPPAQDPQPVPTALELAAELAQRTVTAFETEKDEREMQEAMGLECCSVTTDDDVASAHLDLADVQRAALLPHAYTSYKDVWLTLVGTLPVELAQKQVSCGCVTAR